MILNTTMMRLLDIYHQSVTRGEEVIITMERREGKEEVWVSVRIPPRDGKGTRNGNRDETEC